MSKPQHWSNDVDGQGTRSRGKRGRRIPPELLMYHPDELLSPAELLKRFTGAAQDLIERIPEEERPSQPAVLAALRQGVLEAFRTREEHLARMVESDLEARGSGNRMSTLKWQVSVRKALLGLGVRVVETADETDLFVVVEGEGEAFEVVRPAYVDQATGKLILSGQLKRVAIEGGGKGGDAQDASQGEETA